DQALFLKMRLSGNALDVLVLPRTVGDGWRESIQQGAQLGPPPAPPASAFVLQPGAEARQKIKLPKGQYYVVIDNSAQIGTVSPPWNPLSSLGAATCVLSYVAELGDDDDEF